MELWQQHGAPQEVRRMSDSDVTALLEAFAGGDAGALDRLFPLV
jgi:hypothetical protein